MENVNPFKEIGQPSKEVPKELKVKVMNDVSTLKLIMEASSLFSSNYAGVVEGFFKKREREKKKKDSQNE